MYHIVSKPHHLKLRNEKHNMAINGQWFAEILESIAKRDTIDMTSEWDGHNGLVNRAKPYKARKMMTRCCKNCIMALHEVTQEIRLSTANNNQTGEVL